LFTRNSRSLKTLSVVTLFLSAGFLVPGLSTASVRELQIIKAVAKNFEAHRFDSDYRYYTLMDGDIPYAVVGLKKNYRISDISWKKMDPNSAQLSHLMDLVQLFPVQGSVAYGAYILDSQSTKIGTWYSGLTAGVTVNNENKTVSITTDRSTFGK
jgi:hypothetical protein